MTRRGGGPPWVHQIGLCRGSGCFSAAISEKTTVMYLGFQGPLSQGLWYTALILIHIQISDDADAPLPRPPLFLPGYEILQS